jgi:hypothetical protein
MPASWHAVRRRDDDLPGNRIAPRFAARHRGPHRCGREGDTAMTTIPTAGLLRSALTLDAAMSGAGGVALVVASGPIAQATALPAPLLLACGLFFLPYAAVLAWCATRDRLPRWLVWALAGGNALWALDCAALPLLGLVSPNGWGIAFLAAQAVAVTAFAQMYLMALRRAARPA